MKGHRNIFDDLKFLTKEELNELVFESVKNAKLMAVSALGKDSDACR